MSVTTLKFLGAANSYLTSPAPTTYNWTSSDDYTIEWWQKYTANNPNPYIFDVADRSTGKTFSFRFETNSLTAVTTLYLTIADTVYSVGTINLLTDFKNKWLHFAICRSSGIVRVFMNGTQVSEDISDSTELTIKIPPPLIASGNPIYIGVNKLRYNQHAFGGNLYNFIWIKGNALYTTNFTPSNNKSSSSPPSGTLFFLSSQANITTYNFTNPSYYVQDESVTQSLIASTQSPTITISSIPSKTYGIDTTFSISSYITSDSNGAYSYSTSDNTVATIGTDATVTILKAAPSGITITVTQAADGNYTSGSATTTLTINKGTPTFSYNLPQLTAGVDSTINLLDYITSNSTGSLSFSSSDSEVASISGSTLTIVSSGTFTITVSQSMDSNYLSKTETSESIVIYALPTFTYNLPSLTYGVDSSIDLLTYITSNSNGTLSFTSSDSSVASISGNTLTLVSAGSFTITVSQVAAGNYSSKTQTSTTITVKSVPTVTFGLPSSVIYGVQDIDLVALVSTNSTGTKTFSSSNSSVAEVTLDNTLKIKSTGTAVITFSMTSTSSYGSYSTTKTIIAVQATRANPLNIANGNHLVYAVDVLNIPFINVDTYSDKLIRNNTLNTNKLYTINNPVVLFSIQLNNKIMY